MCFFKLQYLWRMLTWTFISRSDPTNLRRTWSHVHLSLLQGTSLQFSKRIVLWKENRSPPESSVLHKHELHFACESFATEFPPFHRCQTGPESDPCQDSDRKHTLCTCLFILPLCTCRLVSRPSLLLTCFWPHSDKLHRKMPHFPSNDHHNNPSSEQPLINSSFFFLFTEYVIMNSHTAYWK